jgi:hypothetical protein
MSAPDSIRLLRGIPTRVQEGGVEYSLGINAVHGGGRSARIGVFVEGEGETTEVELGSQVAVGPHTYAVSHIDDSRVVLDLAGAS